MFILSLIFSCQFSSSKTLAQELELVEKAKLNPSNALNICQEISTENIREECFSISAQQLKGNAQKKEALCKELSGSLRGECFFELAEEVQQVKYCNFAEPFAMDCRLHILEAQCGRFSTLSSLITLTEDLNLDPNHPNVGNILYGCLLSHPQPLGICSQTPDPTKCLKIRKRQQPMP